MGKLILIRHGETDKNATNSLHNAGDLESLNETGRIQVRLSAEKLSSFKPNIVYSSKEHRALESAKIIANILKVPFKEIDGIHERNWGTFSTKPWEEVKKILDPMTLDERYKYIPPEGESWETFENRLIDVTKKIVRENPDKTIVVVTHSGVIRALMPFLLGVSKEESYKYDPDNASLTIFDYDGDKYSQVMINDTSHLAKG